MKSKLRIFYDPQFRSFPWRIGLRNGHLSSETTRDNAIRRAISHIKYSHWRKFNTIEVFNELGRLDFTITRIK